MSSDNPTFGQWLKLARRARDLSREALAERVSCAAPTLAKIEQGSRRPSRELATLLIDTLQIAPEEREQALRLARLPLAAPSAAHQAADLVGEPNNALSLQLPAAATSLIGRAAEQADLLRRLSEPMCRLLTLVGPGGIGKTRLALQAALAARFAGEVAWVELAGLGAAALVAPAIADAVGCALAGATPPDVQLLVWLREHRLLIILDNLEHLLDSEGALAALIAAIMRQAHGVTLLATSRERLRIPGEWVVDVQGLDFPNNRPPTTDQRPSEAAESVVGRWSVVGEAAESIVNRQSSVVDIERYDAVLLFLARARQANADFTLTPANRDAVARICRLLEGLPLAIELAAAWTRALTCQEIADEIARSLDFLARADRAVPTRHHSMRAAFDHSWQLLTDQERHLLAALSVFRGGGTRDAVAAVMSSAFSVQRSEHGDPQPRTQNGELLTLLAALVDKSLVRATYASSGSRYDLHELIRQYAAERLEADAHARHGRYYAALLERRLTDLLSAGRDEAFVEIDPELGNLHQAWGWAVTQRDMAALGMMAQALQAIYEDRGWLREAADLFGQAAHALRADAGAPGGPAEATRSMLGQVLGRHGYFLSRCGSFDSARKLLQESLALLRGGERSLALADTLMNLGFVAYQQGHYAAARDWLDESAAIGGALGAQFFHALSLSFLGMVALAQGQLAEARAMFERSLAIERVNGQPRGLTIVLSFLGRTALAQSRPDEAQSLLHESLSISSRARDRWGVGYAFHHLGALALAQGDMLEARYLQREAADVFAALAERRAYGMALASFADAALALGDVAPAREAFIEALRLAAEAHIPPVGLHALLGVATLWARDQRLAAAYALLLVICRHPAADHVVRTRAQQLRDEIAASLPELDRHAAEVEARVHSLEQTMTRVCESI